jgi:amino-acid N-acetyltransferase
MKIGYRRATLADVKEIKQLVDDYAKKDLMLPRSLHSIYENLRDFHVAESKGRLIGCCALHIVWDNLAEVRTLAVSDSMKGKGIGRKLVQRCVLEGRKLGLPRIFTLTYVPRFFERCGFMLIDKNELPHKVWGDCVHCSKFPDCGEVPLALKLD